MNEFQSEQGTTSAQIRQFDTVSKWVIQQNPEDWISFVLDIPDVTVINVLDTEQHTVRTHRADSFIYVTDISQNCSEPTNYPY